MSKYDKNSSMWTERAIILAFIIFLIFIWRVSQGLISHYKTDLVPTCGVYDALLLFFMPINEFLHSHKEASRWVILSSSLIIDMMLLYFVMYSLYKKTLRWFIGIFFVLLLRQITQIMVVLPLPPGMIWFDPGFPSIGVTYGVSNDLFMSGHIAFTTFGAFALSYIYKNIYIKFFRYFLIIFEISAIASIQGHYFMDIFAGFFCGLAIFYVVKDMKLPQFLERIPSTPEKLPKLAGF